MVKYNSRGKLAVRLYCDIEVISNVTVPKPDMKSTLRFLGTYRIRNVAGSKLGRLLCKIPVFALLLEINTPSNHRLRARFFHKENS